MAKYKQPSLPFDVVPLETFSNTKTPENVRFPNKMYAHTLVHMCALKTALLPLREFPAQKSWGLRLALFLLRALTFKKLI